MKAEWSLNFQMYFTGNGVKQGGYMSPVLFTLYLDVLIQKLKYSGIGCHIGGTITYWPGSHNPVVMHYLA